MDLAPLLAAQSGVVNRQQLADAAIGDSDIARMLRQRRLVRIHRGVYLDHTGKPTWLQRAWAGVLAVEPAAVAGEAALFAAEGRLPRPRRAAHHPGRGMGAGGSAHLQVSSSSASVTTRRSLFHDATLQRDADFDRDLAAAVTATSTVRISWGQVFERPCWTALQVARLLRVRGWTGTPEVCGPSCAIALAGNPAGTP